MDTGRKDALRVSIKQQGLIHVTDSRWRNTLLLFGFSVLAFGVMGYHPGLEDDEVYLAAVKSKLNPALYPHNSIFFRIQLQATLFDNWMAAFVRLTHIPVAVAELLWQFVGIVLILALCRAIAREFFPEPGAQWAGVAMVGAMFTLPVSGTAIYLVDQHLHPRTLAAALILLGVWCVLKGKPLPAVLSLVTAFLIHPIMAAFGASFCLFLAAVTSKQTAACAGQHAQSRSAAAFVLLAPLAWLAPPACPAWYQAIHTREYLFLDRWAWYSWLGVFAPLLLFWLLSRIARRHGQLRLSRFALAMVLYGLCHEIFALLVWQTPALVRLVPMQPMRYLHLVYLFMALIGGCLIGKYWLKSSIWRWTAYLLLFNAGMFAAQIYQLDGSSHLELPGLRSPNPWLQAFRWIRLNTPQDAYFALNPYYLQAPEEDYHGFRALAERSQLADAVKDTAVVGLFPSLAPEWNRQLTAEQGWRHFQLADFERLRAQFGVDWVLLAYPPPAGLDCRWHNATLSVCRVP